jgi:formylglycine-generating enzyme required for sulfatase activity
VWQRTIDPIGHNWNDAHTYCADLGVAGYRDWRLPSVLELVSIADVSRANPAIDPTAFPDTPSLPFWSSETDASNSGLGWYVYFLNGGAYNGNDVVDPQRVRCVRGGAPSAGGDAGCYAMNDGTVLDPNTHLTWQRALDPASFAWTDAQAYCASVAANGGGFRLPSMNELMTLVDVTRMDPAIDTAVFPETPSDFFWSSSPGANSAQTAWGVNFNKGSAATSLVDFTSRVRCLR